MVYTHIMANHADAALADQLDTLDSEEAQLCDPAAEEDVILVR